MIEVRWHGRGGQGTKTAALLLADVAFTQGMYVQGFPEYGPERMGAPMTAYTRISTSPIYIHSNIYNPDIVIVADDSLLNTIDVANGLKEKGGMIINTQLSQGQIRHLLPGYKENLYKIDAKSIALRNIRQNMPNMPLLSSVVRISSIVKKDFFIKNMENVLEHRFASKQEVLKGNLKALEEAWDEVERI